MGLGSGARSPLSGTASICTGRHIHHEAYFPCHGRFDSYGLFEAEFGELGSEVQDELLTQLRWLQEFGPILGRPRVDTLKGSTHANMKELRFDAQGGVWRVAFAFDPKREAILLVAGDKSGGSEWRFYKRLIAKADERFDEHLAVLRRQQWQGV